MRKLSKYEKETIINWNEAESLASIYTAWIREMPVNKGYFSQYRYLRQRKQRDFTRKFGK